MRGDRSGYVLIAQIKGWRKVLSEAMEFAVLVERRENRVS